MDYPWRKNKIYLYLIVSGVPKTTLKPDKLWEGLAELKEAIILMVIICWSEGIQIKASKWTKSRRDQAQHVQKVLPTKEPHSVQGFC